MASFKPYLTVLLFIVVLLLSLVANGNGKSNRHHDCKRGGRCGGGRKIRAARYYKSIVVDQSGHGNFSSIQSAINFIQPNLKYWTCIHIKAGTYREKVKISDDKSHIYLKGQGKKKTSIVWGDHDSASQSPTFTSLADNIVVRGISFQNSYNSPGSINPRRPAVAALIEGDKTSFYRCGFFGVQDTLWDSKGRHYFKQCTIQGAVDFIFGSGQSIYDKCVIQVLGNALQPGLQGYITAQGRTRANAENGFVFKECAVIGTGSFYLGRPWRAYARVLFYKTYFANVIQPQGWDPWDFGTQVYGTIFAEHENFGPGSASFNRVKWEKKLDAKTINYLSSMSFIDEGQWIRKQPL